MAMLEYVPQLKASGLTGDYRILADFSDAVLAGHPTERDVRFITWEWDWDRKGVHLGNFFQENYEAAKKDFTVRSGLIPKDAFFELEQLAEIYRCIEFSREQDETLSIGQDQKLQEIMEQIERIAPDASNQSHFQQVIEQSM